MQRTILDQLFARNAAVFTILWVALFGPVTGLGFALADEQKPQSKPGVLEGVSRTIAKQPKYTDSPRYALLVFGDRAQTKVWMVEDGKALYIDKNANGDLTDDGPPIPQTKYQEYNTQSGTAPHWQCEYVLDKITPGSGAQHTDLRLARWNYETDEDEYGLSVKVNGQHEMYAGWVAFFAATPEAAPLIHFAGPLTPKSLRSKDFVIGSDVRRLSIAFANRGKGNGAQSLLSIDAVPNSAIPMVHIDWPVAEGAKPLRTSHRLAERCCYWEFYDSKFKVPESVVPGTATVTISQPAGALPFELATDQITLPVRLKNDDASSKTASHKDRPADNESLDRLVQQLKQPAERKSDEAKHYYLLRINHDALRIADELLLHPKIDEKTRELALEKKLFALRYVTDKEPGHEQQWSEFSQRVLRDYRGTTVEAVAAYLDVEYRVLSDLFRKENVAEIEGYAAHYPNGMPADGIYFNLSNRLERISVDHTTRMLDAAIAVAPPERAATLRNHKAWVKIVGTKPDFSGKTLGDRDFKMEEVKGKVVLIYTWATWCAPCIARFPSLAKLREKYHGRGFEILMVNVDEDPKVALEFTKRRSNSWIDLGAPEHLMAIRAKLGTPGMLLLNREGVVVSKDVLTEAKLDGDIERLLEKK